MLAIDESFDGKELELKPGEELEIRLLENPTTGFRWHVVSGGAAVGKLVRDEYTPQGGMIGAGGERCWLFHAERPGSARIELAKRRRWEQGAPARTFAVDLRVRS